MISATFALAVIKCLLLAGTIFYGIRTHQVASSPATENDEELKCRRAKQLPLFATCLSLFCLSMGWLS